MNLSGVAEAQLLEILQQDFPLVERPFHEIGASCGLTEEQVLTQVHRLIAENLIRDVSAFFNLKRMGWYSTLIACEVETAGLEEVAARINSHPGVSHNYLRDHSYNVWFTLAAATAENLEKGLKALVNDPHIRRYRNFPALRTFKIGVNFRLGAGMKKEADRLQLYPESAVSLTNLEQKVISCLNAGIPLEARFWDKPAAGLGITIEALFSVIRGLKQKGVLKRISALLRHRNAGFSHNAMVCFNIPEQNIQDAGTRLAAFEAVSHCYQRPVYPDWPYPLFAMMHARSESTCRNIIRQMTEAIQCRDYIVLFSRRELKKEKIRISERFYEHTV